MEELRIDDDDDDNNNHNNNGAHQRPGRRIRVNVSQSLRRQSDQNYLSSTPYHTVFVFFNSLLVGVLQVNGQVTNVMKALIESHTANMCTFLSALLIYCLAYFADMKYSQRLQIFSSIAIISRSLSSVSLLSMILPRPCRYFSFILWAFILLLIVGLHVWNKFRGTKQQLLPP